MVAGLVAVDISANEALLCDVFVGFVILLGKVHAEEFIQLAQEFLFAAHELHYTQHIVGHVEGEVEGVALDKTLFMGLEHVKLGLEVSVAEAWAGKADFGVINLAVVERALQIFLRQAFVSAVERSLVDGPVVIAIFQRGGCGGSAGFQGHVAQLVVFA